MPNSSAGSIYKSLSIFEGQVTNVDTTGQDHGGAVGNIDLKPRLNLKKNLIVKAKTNIIEPVFNKINFIK